MICQMRNGEKYEGNAIASSYFLLVTFTLVLTIFAHDCGANCAKANTFKQQNQSSHDFQATLTSRRWRRRQRRRRRHRWRRPRELNNIDAEKIGRHCFR